MLTKKICYSVLGAIGLISSALAGAPRQLITHNYTHVESNAFIDGVIASQHPTKAQSDNRVFWASVKLACFGHAVDNTCKALIKMKTDTTKPIDLGWVYVNLLTGDITPNSLSKNGYRLEVNGPGETSLYEDQ
jgi:hypothetical protein